jgi:ATP-dependent helicase/nuclease subunit B
LRRKKFLFADIFVSRFHEEALEGVIGKLKAVDCADLEANHIVITPDRHTLSLEKKIYPSLKGKGSFNISVLTLKRLCLKISPKKHISSNCAIMLVSKAVNDCLPQLGCFKSSAGHYGFYQSMYREICRLKNSFVTYDDLIKAAEGSGGEFALRLKDVALIYQRFLTLTQYKYIDLSSYLYEIIAAADSSGLIKNSHFYFLGFDEATGAEIRTFAAIAKNSMHSCFGVCREGGLLEGLTAELKKRDILYKEHNLNGGGSPRGDFIYNNIESGGGRWQGENPEIKLFALNNIMEETENAAQQIIKLVREEGFRFKDIFVTLPNAEDYIYSLEKVFKSYAVPYYLAESAALSAEPLFKALQNLLIAAEGNCGAENVLSFVKSAYFGDGNAAVFENYCLKYGIDRSRFLQPFTLCDDEDDLPAAESVRQKFVRFYNMVVKSGNLKDFTASARKILQNFSSTDSGALAGSGYIEEAAYRGQAEKKLNKLLDEIDEFAPFQNVSLKQFIQMLTAGAQSQKLAIIPQSVDAVICGGVESAKYSYPKALFVLGAAEGKFPAVSYAPMILTHNDLKKHTALAVAEGDLAGQLKSLRLKIKRLLGGGGRIFMSYHTSGGEGKDLFPSDYFVKIQKMFGLNVESSLPFALNLTPLPHNFDYDTLSAAGNLYFKSGKTSVSAIETYFTCPRKFLFSYGYYARLRKEAGLKSADMGIFLHEVAELFMKQYRPPCDIEALADNCYNEVLSREQYQRFISSEKAVFGMLKDEINRVCKALALITDKSKFVPQYFEAEFNDNADFPLIKISGGVKPVNLRGKIDRIDVYSSGGKKYVRIIDYKSGNAEYSEKDLYFGNKLQLFIYAKALSGCGFIPSGAYYFPIHDKFVPENESPYRLIGVTVDEEEILSASDEDIPEKGASGILKLNLKFKSANLISRQKLNDFIDYAVKAAEGAVNEILQGYCAVSPRKGACAWCDYADVCSVNMPQAAERENNLRDAGDVISEAVNG